MDYLDIRLRERIWRELAGYKWLVELRVRTATQLQAIPGGCNRADEEYHTYLLLLHLATKISRKFLR